MSHYLKAKFCLLAAAFIVGGAFAAETSTTKSTEGLKGLTFSGYSEGGYAYSFAPSGSNDPHFLLDAAEVKMNFDVSDKVKVVVDNAFALRPLVVGNAVGIYRTYDSWNYFAPNTTLFSANSAINGPIGLSWAVNQAYIETKWTDSFSMWVGQYKNVIGMESMFSRYDMPTYYYSQAYNALQLFNAFYDVGVKLAFMGDSWGTLEISITDNKNFPTPNAAAVLPNETTGSQFSPAAAVRYSYDYKNGDMSLTPTVSAYVGKLNNWSPQDYAFTGGLGYKMGMFMADAEFLYTNLDPNGADSSVKPWKTWSVYLEPGVDLGMATLSVKGEYYSQDQGTGTANTDFNIGVALSHNYSDKLRFRLAYQHNNFSQPASNDIRLLVGTKF